jgi:hypothetical protein
VGRWFDRLEALPLGVRIALAWLVCLLPRALAAATLGLVGDYLVFADASARTRSWWYPLYRWLAETLWAASGGSAAVHAGWHMALHAAVGPLVYGCCRRLRLSAATSWLAVVGVALLPYYVSLSSRQPQVGVVVSFVALMLWVFLGWRNGGFGWLGALGFAALGALSALLRPNLLLTVGALYALALVEVAWGQRGRVAAALRVGVSGFLVALALFGLAASSRARTGHWSPFQPLAGYNLWLGHNERAGAYLRRWDILSLEDVVRDHGFPPEVEGIEDPYERDREFGRLAVEFARAHPRETLENTLLKAARYWDFRLEDADENPPLWNLAYSAPYLASLLLALLGARRWARAGHRYALLVVTVLLVSYWLPHLVMFPTIRMRMTTEFALILLAAEGLAGLVARDRARA